MPMNEIEELTSRFVEQLLPVQIYLFGSYADCTYGKDSDFDFYIIVQDTVLDIPAETTKAYKSIRRVKRRPVDIVVGTISRFEARKDIPSIENEVYKKGVLLYDARGAENRFFHDNSLRGILCRLPKENRRIMKRLY